MAKKLPSSQSMLGTGSTLTCQQIADQINSLENAEILLKAAVDVANLQLLAAQQSLMVAQQNLNNNLNQQLALHGLANSMGCNLGTGH